MMSSDDMTSSFITNMFYGTSIGIIIFIIFLREAFQSKKQRNLGIQNLGGVGVAKKSKKSQVSVGKSSKLLNKNSPKFQ